jgi:predicted pyridoxine 5'-phosphate oxidase superfamily flavin-nucleotide-binding protein
MTAMTVSPDHLVTSMEALERLYGEPFGPSLVKETTAITGPYRAFIEAAPFFALASGGPDGIRLLAARRRAGLRAGSPTRRRCSSRTGAATTASTRCETSSTSPRVALLFLIPGCGETIRVNGRATISTDPALTHSFVIAARSAHVIVVTVERIYYQCAKAIVRSKLGTRRAM